MSCNTIISTNGTSTINTNKEFKVFNANKVNTVETDTDNIVESDSEFREVVKKGYLLNAINLATIPSIIQDAIDQAILDAKNQTLSDALIQELRDSIDNLNDGVYTKTYINDIMTYVEDLIIQKAGSGEVAAIADSRIAVASDGFASTSSVNMLTSRVGDSESEIITVKETMNTNEIAQALQITTLEASINETFAGYSEAIDLTVNADGSVSAGLIEGLRADFGGMEVSITEISTLIGDTEANWLASSQKLITAPDGGITGYSFQDGSGLVSDFRINSDDFKISNSSDTFSPFSITNGKLRFNGESTFSNTVDSSGRNINDLKSDLSNQIDNIAGVDTISWQQEVQSVLDNNSTVIDGGKIVTNAVFLNNLNATGGVIASKIDVDNGNGFILDSEATGTSSTPNIEGAYIKGATFEASNMKVTSSTNPNNLGAFFYSGINPTLYGSSYGSGFYASRICNSSSIIDVSASIDMLTGENTISYFYLEVLSSGSSAWQVLDSTQFNISGVGAVQIPIYLFTSLTGSNFPANNSYTFRVRISGNQVYSNIKVKVTINNM